MWAAVRAACSRPRLVACLLPVVILVVVALQFVQSYLFYYSHGLNNWNEPLLSTLATPVLVPPQDAVISANPPPPPPPPPPPDGVVIAGAQYGLPLATADDGVHLLPSAGLADLVALLPFLPAVGHFPLPHKFTAILITYNRPAHVVWVVQQLMGCRHLDRVYVVANDHAGGSMADLPPAVAAGLAPFGDRVVVRFPAVNSLNNRFWVPPDLRTNSILVFDDDVKVGADELDAAFESCAPHYPLQPCGLYPRAVRHSAAGVPTYDQGHKLRGRNTAFHLVLNNAFVDVRFLLLYHREEFAPLREYVDQHMNCEDVLFNMMVAHVTGLPSVYFLTSAHQVQADEVREADSMRAPGLSKAKGHRQARSACIQFATHDFFHGWVLQSSQVMLAPYSLTKTVTNTVLSAVGRGGANRELVSAPTVVFLSAGVPFLVGVLGTLAMVWCSRDGWRQCWDCMRDVRRATATPGGRGRQ